VKLVPHLFWATFSVFYLETYGLSTGMLASEGC
jgi:hypothetical protein